jgi:sigma-B regulation protein RsbU (phosphoserine phosphatase)
MKHRLMAVDDEANILKALKRELAPWAELNGYEILTETSPELALGRLEELEGGVDLLICDMNMPAMKGSELISRAKARWPQINAILLSAYSEAPEIARAVRAGIWGFILKPWDHDYLVAEVEKVRELADVRRREQEHSRRLDNELRLAGELQRAMMSIRLPPENRSAFALLSRPVSDLHCSGDYADIIPLGRQRFLLLAGDVAGHGVTGALVTFVLKSVIFTEYVRHHIADFSPAAFLNWLNRRMTGALARTRGVIISFAAVSVDLGSRSLVWALAGHNPPILVGSGGHRFLAAEGPALGFVEQAEYADHSLNAAAGDSLWLFTDGLVEVHGDSPEAGTRRLAAVLGRRRLPSASGDGATGHDAIARAIVSDVLAESGHPAYDDDVTLLGLAVP